MRLKDHYVVSFLVITFAVTGIFFTTLEYNSLAQSSSLVSYYTFDSTSNDSRGTNHLTLNGGTYASGQSGSALQLNGVNNYASRSDSQLTGLIPAKSSGGSQDFTISAWIKLDQLGRRSPIVTKQGNSTRGFVFQVSSNNQLGVEVFKNATNGSFLTSNNTLSANTWTHTAVTYDYQTDGTSILTIYVDGVNRGSINNAIGPVVGNTQSLEVGRYYWSTSSNWYFDGTIDEVRIHNSALTSSEIQIVMNDLPTPPTQPPTQTCNNGQVEGTETCDQNSTQCTTLGFDNGTATCNSVCTGWVTGSCSTTTPPPTTTGIWPDIEARCTQLGDGCGCSEPLDSSDEVNTSGLNISNSGPSYDCKGTIHSNNVDRAALACSNCHTTKFISTEEMVLAPYNFPPLPTGTTVVKNILVDEPYGQLNVNDIERTFTSGTYCSRAYFILGQNIEATDGDRVKLFRNTGGNPAMDHQSALGFGRLQSHTFFDTWNTGSTNTSWGNLTDIRGHWIRFETCIDHDPNGTSNKTNRRFKFTYLDGSVPEKEVTHFGDKASTIPVSIGTNNMMIDGFRSPGSESSLLSPGMWSGYTGVMSALVGYDPDFWINGAVEVEGSGSTPPLPPPLPPTGLTSLYITPVIEGRSLPDGLSFAVRVFNTGQATPLATFTITANSQGRLLIPSNTLTSGIYDIHLKPIGHLGKRFTNISLSGNTTVALSGTIRAGDLNNDNVINTLDWSVMNPLWFTNDLVADLNGDGIVNTIDFSFLSNNWFEMGE